MTPSDARGNSGTEALREAVARAIYETQEQLRADDDIPGSPWCPWESQTSTRERRIAYAMADAALAAYDAQRGSTAATPDARRGQ